MEGAIVAGECSRITQLRADWQRYLLASTLSAAMPTATARPQSRRSRRTRANSVPNANAATMSQKEVAEALRISQRQLQKLEKAGAFPIPRLPALSRTPMYSREDVERYARGELKLNPKDKAGKGRRAA